MSPPPAPSLAGEYLSGHVAAKRNAIEAAADAYAEAHEGAPADAKLLKTAFFFNVAAGDIENAAPLAEQLIAAEEDEQDILARLALAARAIRRGDPAGARRYINDPQSAPYLKSAAFLVDVWIERDLNGPEAALKMLENTPEGVFKGFNPVHVALIAEEAGALETAQAAHQVSVFGLGGPIGRTAYGAFLERTDEAAAREYYALLSRERGASRRTAEAGVARLDRKAASKAFRNVSTARGAAIALHGFGYSSLVQIAQEHARLEKAGFNVNEPQYNLPLAVAQIAGYLDPSLHETRSLIGQIYNAYGDVEAARAYFDTIPASSPAYEPARIYLAAGYASTDQTAEAIAVLKEAVSRDRGAVEARFTLADLYALEQRFEDTLRTVDDVLERVDVEAQEDAWRYLVTRGGALVELGRWEEAERDLVKAVEIAPEQSRALNALGYRWVERGENLEEAFSMIEKAVALVIGPSETVDRLGGIRVQR
ncbi:MAG: hypothetical protein AAGJ87_08400, partial [Pseudomonadota bacterium]